MTKLNSKLQLHYEMENGASGHTMGGGGEVEAILIELLKI